jgi:hypothetical protein
VGSCCSTFAKKIGAAAGSTKSVCFPAGFKLTDKFKIPIVTGITAIDLDAVMGYPTKACPANALRRRLAGGLPGASAGANSNAIPNSAGGAGGLPGASAGANSNAVPNSAGGAGGLPGASAGANSNAVPKTTGGAKTAEQKGQELLLKQKTYKTKIARPTTYTSNLKD